MKKMMHLITGGSGSGKSQYAEKISQALGQKRIYIATMYPWDYECVRKIDRHRRMRVGSNFETFERYMDLKGLKLPKSDVVLLECASNLVSNEMYMEGGAGKDTAKSVMEGIDSVLSYTKNLVIVTNEVFSDGCPFDANMKDYIRTLGEINTMIAQRADRVT